MDFDTIQTTVASELNRSDLSTAISGWVNIAYHDIMSRRMWSFLQATAEVPSSVAQYRYKLPDDFWDIRDVILDDGQSSVVLPVVSGETYDLSYPDPSADSVGKPIVCCVTRGVSPLESQYSELWVWPPPDSVYTIRVRYYMNFGDLAAGTDVPKIPARFHRGIVFGAVELGMMRLREYEAAGMWRGKKEEVVAQMVASEPSPDRHITLGKFSSEVVYPGDYHTKWWIGSVR